MLLDELAAAVIAADETEVERKTREALKNGIYLDDLARNGLGRGLQICVEKYSTDEYSISEVLSAVDIVERALDMVEEETGARGRVQHRTVVLGVIQGSSQDLGKNLIKMLLRCNAIEVVDLGKNVPPEQFIRAAIASDATLVAVSAMTTVSIPHCQELMSMVAESGLREKLKVVVGGTAISAELAENLHFDGYAKDALGALDLALALLAV